MIESQQRNGPEETSRFRVVVVASLRVRQLRGGSKPRIELDDKKHKDTIIAMEEVRRGLINFTQSARPVVHDPSAMRGMQLSVEDSLPALV